MSACTMRTPALGGTRGARGSPELPGLMAASIWTPSSWLPWPYSVTSMRDTTPLVTEMVSPPTG